MRKNVGTVGEYLALVPAPARAALRNLRKTIKAAAPAAVESISYGMPTFKLGGRPLVYFAAFRDHCSLFAASRAVMAANKAALAGYETSKGTIRFTPDKPLPATLVRKIVKARIKENQAKSRK